MAGSGCQLSKQSGMIRFINDQQISTCCVYPACIAEDCNIFLHLSSFCALWPGLSGYKARLIDRTIAADTRQRRHVYVFDLGFYWFPCGFSPLIRDCCPPSSRGFWVSLLSSHSTHTRMASLFWRQFKALFLKNTIVIQKYWLVCIFWLS